MQRLLVTGGAGFIGSNFIHHVLQEKSDCSVVNLDKLTYAGNLENLADVSRDPRYCFVKGDVCDRELVASLFREHGFDRVVNFAAESHVDRSILDPGVFAQTNFMGTLNLLSCARQAWESGGQWKDGCLYLQVSTDEVYGSLGETGFFTEDTPLNPHSPYSASKASADMLVKAWHDTYGMPAVITRCSNNYGPYQFPEKLIPLIIHNCLQHKPLPVYGDGRNVRDWLYVGDHCRAISMALERGRPGEVYNIGGHNERRNIDVVRSIVRWLHDNVDESIDEGLIRHVGDRKGHDWRYAIDPAKITRETGWAPGVAFEDGIVRTIRWYLENRKWVERVVGGKYMRYYEENYGGREGMAD